MSLYNILAKLMSLCANRINFMAAQRDYSEVINKVCGQLTILEVFKCNRAIKARCQCSCGNTTTSTDLRQLLAGKITKCKACACRANGTKITATLRQNTAKYIGQTFNYFTVIDHASVEEAGKSGLYKCQCICGKIVFKDLCALRNVSGKGAKSCGCQQRRLLSLAGGGTGIPHETVAINEFIRKRTPEYKAWVTECLIKANFTCSLSGRRGGSLQVYHIMPLHKLIRQYSITKENYLDYLNVLFDISNAAVVSETLHREFHKLHGYDIDSGTWQNFAESVILRSKEQSIQQINGISPFRKKGDKIEGFFIS